MDSHSDRVFIIFSFVVERDFCKYFPYEYFWHFVGIEDECFVRSGIEFNCLFEKNVEFFVALIRMNIQCEHTKDRSKKSLKMTTV